jgi:hypothetical protein
MPHYSEYEEGGHYGDYYRIPQGRVPPLRHLAEDRILDHQRSQAQRQAALDQEQDYRNANALKGGYGTSRQPMNVDKVLANLQEFMNSDDPMVSRNIMRRIHA